MEDTLEKPAPWADTATEPTEAPTPVDYFGFSSTKLYYLPDKVSYVELKVMNEGERRNYANETNREVRFGRNTGEAAIKMKPGDDRMLLLKKAVVGWNLRRGGEPVPFNAGTLQEFLNVTDPKIVDLIEKEIRLMNPWLLAELSLEDMDREIEQLQEMRRKKAEEEEGN